ncbi:MAG: radical SAM protein [Candidatus Abyssubacteria bacterium]
MQTYVFGPVPSRRLGRSLGVDLVPYKTCSYDCTYCQLGRTTVRTIERTPYVPLSEVLDQLWRVLDEGEQPDYITLSGSGEPTLHSEFGRLIHAVKARSRVPIAVLTNGSLLWDEAVRNALIEADLVVPSLDAGDNDLFQRINRPDPRIVFETMVRGLVEFRQLYTGKIWLEVFLLDGTNTTPMALQRIRQHLDAMSPDKIQLNTAVRPPAEEYALRVSDSELMRIRQFFGDKAEIIAPYEGTPDTQKKKALHDEILTLLRRRPCTLDDVSNGLGVHRNEALKHLERLKEQDLVREIRRDGLIYFQAVGKPGSASRV